MKAVKAVENVEITEAIEIVETTNTNDATENSQVVQDNIVSLEEKIKTAKKAKAVESSMESGNSDLGNVAELKEKAEIKFAEFNLHPSIQAALDRMKFTSPTPIQAASIPVALSGQDILGTAQTGTGKTAAYAIPIISKLIEDENATALILAPTRELAAQILEFIKTLLGNKNAIRIALLIGGDSMAKQFFQLRAKPRIIVGTPGRINDHLDRGSLDLTKASVLVLDEADRMLDMGFGIQIDEILKSVPQDKQTLLFSATLPKEIIKLAERYQNNPKRIAIGAANAPVARIEQEVVRTQDGQMYSELIKRLDSCDGSIIVFVNTKFGADKLAIKLCDAGYEAQAIHGDLQQRKRERVIAAFRAGRIRILVATDVAARGLDVPSVELVVNFGLPQCPEDYIHRIGRTGRAGAKGKAISFVTPSENKKWRAIEQILNPGSSSSSNSSSGERHDRNDRYARPARSNNRARPSFGGGKRDGDFRRERSDRFDRAPRQDRFEGPRKPREDREGKVVDIREHRQFSGGFKKSGNNFGRPERSQNNDSRGNFRRDSRDSGDSRDSRESRGPNRDSRDFRDNGNRDTRNSRDGFRSDNGNRDFRGSRDSRDSRDFNRSRDSREGNTNEREGAARKPYKKFGSGSTPKQGSGKPFPFPGYKKGGRPTLRKKTA